MATTAVRRYNKTSAPSEDSSMREYLDAELRKLTDTLEDLRRGLTLSVVTYTVANLPSAVTSGMGARAFVTDANATTFNSIVAGGGTNKLSVFSDGTNWRIG
jgi:hypothetical protein